MPSSLLKSFADRSGKSLSEVERLWKETKDELLKDMNDTDPAFWAQVNLITQRKLGIKEEQNLEIFTKILQEHLDVQKDC